jgi:hypothetical protein
MSQPEISYATPPNFKIPSKAEVICRIGELDQELKFLKGLLKLIEKQEQPAGNPQDAE